MNPETSLNATLGLFRLFVSVFAAGSVGYFVGGNPLGDPILLSTAFLAAVVWGVCLITGRFDAETEKS